MNLLWNSRPLEHYKIRVDYKPLSLGSLLYLSIWGWIKGRGEGVYEIAIIYHSAKHAKGVKVKNIENGASTYEKLKF